MRKYKQDMVIDQAQYPAPQPIYVTSGGGAIFVIVTFVFAVIVIYGTYRDKESAALGMWGSVLFYGVVTPLGLMAINGGLALIWRHYQEFKTIREVNRIELRKIEIEAGERIALIQPMQIDYRPTADPVQIGEARYIPAVPKTTDTIKLDAANFIAQLFDPSNGRPLASKITKNKGQIQHKSPSAEAVEYLESLGIVAAPDGKQLYWNSTHYPTLHEALRSVRTGVKRPSYEKGEGGGSNE